MNTPKQHPEINITAEQLVRGDVLCDDDKPPVVLNVWRKGASVMVDVHTEREGLRTLDWLAVSEVWVHTPRPVAVAGAVDATRSAWVRLVDFWRTKPRTTLPTDSAFRKEIPVHTGTYEYFPAAMVCIALLSKLSNDKHNPGEKLHHSRGKSADHPDCIARHTLDLADFLSHGATDAEVKALEEATCRAWRACAEVQLLSERIGAPLAPAAVLPTP